MTRLQTGMSYVVRALVGVALCCVCLAGLTSCQVAELVEDVADRVTAEEHNFGEWTVATKATYTHAGYEMRVCSDCGYVESREIPMLTLTFDDTDIAEDKVMNGHTFGPTVKISDPTCTEPGLIQQTCLVCDIVEDILVPALGHTMVAATCTEPATCSVCGYTEGEALGHTWNEGTVTKEPTCTETGIRHCKCTVCGVEEDFVIPANGHTWAEPTCEKASTCVVCGATSGKALGHTWVAATCTTPKTCSVCGATSGKALGHSWAAATCTEPATCTRCGETKGEPLGHTWIEATCTDPKTCSVCGATEGTTLPHTWIEATCTEPKTCSVCGVTEGTALGHDVHDGVCSRCGTVVAPITGSWLGTDAIRLVYPSSDYGLDYIARSRGSLTYPFLIYVANNGTVAATQVNATTGASTGKASIATYKEITKAEGGNYLSEYKDSLKFYSTDLFGMTGFFIYDEETEVAFYVYIESGGNTYTKWAVSLTQDFNSSLFS